LQRKAFRKAAGYVAWQKTIPALATGAFNKLNAPEMISGRAGSKFRLGCDFLEPVMRPERLVKVCRLRFFST
jgi:hypothetical protein